MARPEGTPVGPDVGDYLARRSRRTRGSPAVRRFVMLAKSYHFAV